MSPLHTHKLKNPNGAAVRRYLHFNAYKIKFLFLDFLYFHLFLRFFLNFLIIKRIFTFFICIFAA